MSHSRFLGTLFAVLALLGFMGSQTALAAYPTASEFSMNKQTRGLDGSFQLAVMGGSAIPLDMSPEKFPEKVQLEKPAVEKPKATPPNPKKASKPKEKKVKKAKVKKAPAKKPVEEEGFLTKTFKQLIGSDDAKKDAASKSLLQKTSGKKPETAKNDEGLLTKTFKQLIGDDDDKKKAAPKSQPQKTAAKKSEPEKKEEGFLTKTLKTLVGDDKDKKKAAPKSQPQKTAAKKSEPEKKEEGFLTKTLKTLVGDDKDKKKEQTTKKKSLSSINTAPTGSTIQKKGEEPSKTAKSETKKTLKDSFEKLIGVGAVSDDGGDSKSAKTDKPAGKIKTAKKQTKAKNTVKKTSAPAKPRKLTAKKYVEEEEEQEGRVKQNYAGAKKGKNVLKESFKNLVTDKKKAVQE